MSTILALRGTKLKFRVHSVPDLLDAPEHRFARPILDDDLLVGEVVGRPPAPKRLDARDMLHLVTAPKHLRYLTPKEAWTAWRAAFEKHYRKKLRSYKR